MKEWRETTHVVGEAEEKGGQCKAKEAENKSKRTHMLKKGDGRQSWRATEAASDRGGETEVVSDRGGERQR